MAIRVIVVGMGARGQDWANQVRSNSAYELVGCVEADSKRRQDAALSLSIPSDRCFADLETALDESDAQAVVVATPAENHKQACELALLR